jgi:hypothetical protein
LKDINQYPIQRDISPFEDGHELQIHVVVSRNLVCVDEFLHFQEDPEKISEFPYSEFPFEHCCNEELESVIEHRKDCFYSSEEEKEFSEFEFKRDVSYGYIHEDFQEETIFFHTY